MGSLLDPMVLCCRPGLWQKNAPNPLASFSEYGFAFSWGAGAFHLVSVSYKGHFVHELLLMRCVCGREGGSGPPTLLSG